MKPIPNVTEQTTLRKHYDDKGNLLFFSVWQGEDWQQNSQIVYISKEQARNFMKTFERELG